MSKRNLAQIYAEEAQDKELQELYKEPEVPKTKEEIIKMINDEILKGKSKTGSKILRFIGPNEETQMRRGLDIAHSSKKKEVLLHYVIGCCQKGAKSNDDEDLKAAGEIMLSRHFGNDLEQMSCLLTVNNPQTKFLQLLTRGLFEDAAQHVEQIKNDPLAKIKDAIKKQEEKKKNLYHESETKIKTSKRILERHQEAHRQFAQSQRELVKREGNKLDELKVQKMLEEDKLRNKFEQEGAPIPGWLRVRKRPAEVSANKRSKTSQVDKQGSEEELLFGEDSSSVQDDDIPQSPVFIPEEQLVLEEQSESTSSNN